MRLRAGAARLIMISGVWLGVLARQAGAVVEQGPIHPDDYAPGTYLHIIYNPKDDEAFGALGAGARYEGGGLVPASEVIERRRGHVRFAQEHGWPDKPFMGGGVTVLLDNETGEKKYRVEFISGSVNGPANATILPGANCPGMAGMCAGGRNRLLPRKYWPILAQAAADYYGVAVYYDVNVMTFPRPREARCQSLYLTAR